MSNPSKSTRILGFDISTATIGFGVVDIEEGVIKYVDSGYFKPPKKGDIFTKLQTVQQNIISILDKYSADEIAIEDILLFMKNKSQAKTIVALSIFNRTVGLTILNKTNKSPNLYNVMSIRHGLKLSKELPKKHDMPYVLETHLNIKFPFSYDKKNLIKEESYDQCDGLCVATYAAKQLIKNNLTSRKDNEITRGIQHSRDSKQLVTGRSKEKVQRVSKKVSP